MYITSVQSFTAKVSLAVCTALALSACGGSDSPSTVIEQPPEPSVPSVNQAKTFSGPLVQAGEADVSRYLKNGVYSSTLYGAALETTDSFGAPAPTLSASNRVSDTNTQVQGVDEADRIEYDGDYLYVSTFPEWIEGEQKSAKIRILKRQDDFSLEQVSELQVSEKGRELDGIYLGDNRLAAIGASYPIYPLSFIAIEPWIPDDGKIDVAVFDTTAPEQSTELASIQIDGWLLGSRRIGDELFVISSYVPALERLAPGEQSDDVLIQNYQAIQDTPTADLMPKITLNGTSVEMNDAGDCYIPQAATEEDGFAQLLTVTRINMQQPQDNDSMCMSTMAFMMYMSQDSLYLAGDLNGDTVFHKVQLSDLSYQATGTVEGQIGWRGAPNLRVDERNGYFKVVSTDYSGEEPDHKLTVLQQQGNELNMVAQLPSEAQPEAIGKPGEDIFAVRFFEDKAYIVTFEQIDPLYVIDTSNPTQPVVEGSLEIPGFSSYLHPMGGDYLLGVGQQVELRELDVVDPDDGDNGDGTTDDDSVTTRPPVTVTTGMKVSLFDITDPKQPKELTSIVKDKGFTPVEFDYLALSFVADNGYYRFAIPMEQWGSSSDDGTGDTDGNGDVVSTSIIADINNSLLLLDVDTNDSTPSLNEVDQMGTPKNDVSYGYVGNDRSVIHGDHVYYIHGNGVWHGRWQDNESVDGPY